MARNPLVKLECNRRWRALHWKESREATDRWRANNREKYNEYRRKWRAENKALMQVQNRKRRLKNFKLTPEAYDLMLKVQNGVCAICGGLPVANKKYLSVDHNHTTGKNRGLLCGLCNFAISRIEQDSEWGNKALSYLKKYQGVN